jgi:hypothetical protein
MCLQQLKDLPKNSAEYLNTKKSHVQKYEKLNQVFLFIRWLY